MATVEALRSLPLAWWLANVLGVWACVGLLALLWGTEREGQS